MPNKPPEPCSLAVTGIGVACGFGHGKPALWDGLLSAPNLFGFLGRPGRQPFAGQKRFIGIEMPDPPSVLAPRVERTVGLSGRVAVSVLNEAWQEADLDSFAPERIGLIVGGSNFSSRESALASDDDMARPGFISPRHGHEFLDFDLSGICTASFPIRGFSQTVNAASASGSAATIQAMEAVRSGRVDVCIALGGMQDVSALDLHRLRALGAMGSERYADTPNEACRPMSRDHDGFIFGEASAALVIERANSARSHYGILSGSAQIVDGNRGPQPDSAGQQRAARMALAEAGLCGEDIDYLNGHATGTPLGDETELESYRQLGLHGAWTNTTKSILGHGLSAAGSIELAALLLQMRHGILHPSRNLSPPLDDTLRWVGDTPQPHQIQKALKLSFGFGGINTALVIEAPSQGAPQS